MRGAGEILNTLLNVVTTGRSKFPKALKEISRKANKAVPESGGSEK